MSGPHDKPRSAVDAGSPSGGEGLGCHWARIHKLPVKYLPIPAIQPIPNFFYRAVCPDPYTMVLRSAVDAESPLGSN